MVLKIFEELMILFILTLSPSNVKYFQTCFSVYEFLIRLDTNWCKDIKCTTFDMLFGKLNLIQTWQRRKQRSANWLNWASLV
jgi:hypothetical protein